MKVDGRRNSTPHDRRLDSGEPEDLRHLGDVSEHVGQIADAHRAPEVRRTRKPGFEVPQRRLPVDEELVHQGLPRADRKAPGLDERANALLRLGPDLEIVVDGCQLTVEREAQPLVRLELREDLVDDVDERDPERLERAIPLAVPVRVWDEEDAQLLTEPASRPCTK
jgi:hypothetical protein